MSTSLKRIRLLTAIALVLVLTCSALLFSMAEEPVTLRVAWWGNQVRNTNTVNALEAYAAAHPGVTFQYEYSDWGGYWDKLAAQAASGSLPDIVQMDYAYIMQYVTKNQLHSLEEYIKNGIIDTQYIADSILDPATVNGERYGISMGLTLTCLEYDKAVVETAGITIGEQLTWDEYIECSKTIYEKTGVKSFFPADRKMLEIMSRSYGLELFNAEEHKIGLPDTSLFEKFFTITKETNEAEWHISPETLIEKSTASIETHPIVDQTTWTAFFQTNQAPSLQLACGRELGVTNYPQIADAPATGYNMGTSSWACISSTSAHKDIAAEVIDYLTNSEVARDSLGVERGIPSSTAMADYIKPTLSAMEQESIILTNTAAAKAKGLAVTPPGTGEFDALLNDLIEQIRYDEISPKEAAEQLYEEGNEILTRAAE